MGIGIGDVVSGGMELFKKVKTCMANIEVKQPCLADDSSNIRAILKELDQMKEQMAANHVDIVAHLDLVRREMKQQYADSKAEVLGEMEKNVHKSSIALVALVECLDAASQGQTTCTAYDGVTERKNVPIQDAIMLNRVTLVDVYTNLIKKDVSELVTAFSGLSSTTYRGLAYHYWSYVKLLQDESVGVSNVAVKSSTKVPIITPTLSKNMNEFIQYYRDLFDQLAITQPFVAALIAGDDKQKMAQAEVIAARVQDEIYSSTRRDSVRGTLNYYKVPIVNEGEIVLWTPNGGIHIHAGAGGKYPLTYDWLSFGTAIINKHYNKVSAVRQGSPDAFPVDGVYGVTAPVFEQTLKIESKTTNVIQLNPKDDVTSRNRGLTGPFKMQMKNDKPTWNTNDLKGNTFATPKGKVLVNFEGLFKTYMSWDAEFDWQVEKVQECTAIDFVPDCVQRNVGRGAWVVRHTQSSTADFFDVATVPVLGSSKA